MIQNREHYACAIRSSLPADRFHTETGGRFVFTWVVYHLPQIPGNSGLDVNGKRFFGSTHWKIPRDKRKFWKGSPVFPIGMLRMEIRLPFTSFLSFVPFSCCKSNPV